MMKKTSGDYKEAAELFEKYAEKHVGDTTFYSKKAQYEVGACAKALLIINQPKPILIKNMGPEINTASADFDGFQVNDSLFYFSSLRPPKDSVNAVTESFSTKIFVSGAKKNQWQPAMELPLVKTENKMHTANGSFSPEGNTFYFTACPLESNCAIYKSNVYKGLWEKPIRLNDTINLPGSTTTQANIGKDSFGNQILYFASDRPGGIGKMDIWYSIIMSDGTLNAPVNCGPSINSIEDEITPFADSNTGTLYFSSAWHAGLGGFDIFKTLGSGTKWSAPENMGSPLNSGYNDLYFTKYKERGYLSSNRPGGQIDKTSTCCNDIYSWQEEKKKETMPDSILAPLVNEEKPHTNPTETVHPILKSFKINTPVTVYFENDYPSPRSINNTCPESYSYYYKDYIKLESVYQQSFAKDASSAAITTFFETKVRKGYSNLEELTRLIEDEMKKGLSVSLQISGYCSPLTTNSYNQHLARRRISSLKNYFNTYKGGILKKTLLFKDAIIGENKAPAKVSDNFYDTKNSIFNPDAAAERKVEIQVLETK
jgi:hypothetical protein